MSENTENTAVETTNAKPAPKKRAKAERMSVSQIAVQRAKVRNIDTSRAAKEVRSRLRANFDTVCRLDPTVSKVKSAANDGNRWPELNVKVIEELGLIRRAK